jgi:glucan phosphoethanolaminetransferase (alkaline phosphatase superfamily)
MEEEWKIKIDTHKNQRIIGVIIFYFLITFVLSRLMVYLVIGRWLPNFFLTVRGVHIHHYTYGVFLLVLIGFFLILRRPDVESESFKISTALYGIGLGLTFDEFGMWVRLADEYWLRQSYDAIVIILLLLLNIAYYRQVLHGVKEVGKLFKKIFLRLFSIS